MTKAKTKPKKVQPKPDTLRTFIEAIEGTASHTLKPGDTALKILKRWR